MGFNLMDAASTNEVLTGVNGTYPKVNLESYGTSR